MAWLACGEEECGVQSGRLTGSPGDGLRIDAPVTGDISVIELRVEGSAGGDFVTATTTYEAGNDASFDCDSEGCF